MPSSIYIITVVYGAFTSIATIRLFCLRNFSTSPSPNIRQSLNDLRFIMISPRKTRRTSVLRKSKRLRIPIAVPSSCPFLFS